MRNQRGSGGHRRGSRGGRGGQGEGLSGMGRMGGYRGNAHIQDGQNTGRSYGQGGGGRFANLEDGRIDTRFVWALAAIEGESIKGNLNDL